MQNDISYGWAGKILRVNLTTHSITSEPTEPYKAYIGGMGIANKIMYDEVPAGTDPFSPENKIIFAVGPLTASGVPLAGRTTISTLSCFTRGHLVVDAHCGGMLGARIKQAGWDAIIIEGASESPCYIMVRDDKVEIKDATSVWGLGTRAATEGINRIEGEKACVASIGPAGENLLPYSCIMNSRDHCAGAGTGAIMGSKKCKALVIEGNGGVNVADPQAVADLSDYMIREIIGGNNNWCQPSTPQEWAEYYDEGSRWTSHKGNLWGAAEGGPIDTGEPKPGELNTVGYRTMTSTRLWKDVASNVTIKANGCHSCPLHCHFDVSIDKLAEYGIDKTSGSTCGPDAAWKKMNSILKIEQSKEDAMIWNAMTNVLIDDLGLWCNYMQLYRDLGYCIKNGIFEKNLPPEEYNAIDWDKLNRNDPTFLTDLFTMLAKNDSELAYVAHGPIVWCERWGEEEWFDNEKSHIISRLGFPDHHGADDIGQVGAAYGLIFNRDCMVHSGSNFTRQGFPRELLMELSEEMWGDPVSFDPEANLQPITEGKAHFAWWACITDVLHDSLTLCNWVWPMTCSPDRRRNYRGDLDLEAKFFKAVTGEEVTTEELYQAGSKIMTLQRANTVRGMGTTDMRGEHDQITEWSFTMDPDTEPFTEGTYKLEKEDFYKTMTLFYKQFGWDEELGCPTRKCLEEHDMNDVLEELDQLNLLP